MWYRRRLKKIKWSEKVANEQVLGLRVEKRTLTSNNLNRRVNSIGHILRINCLLHVDI